LRNAVRLAGSALAIVLVGACSDLTQPVVEPPSQYIAVRRAWSPGERDSLVQYIVTHHTFVFPYVGDISDLAPQIYADTESTTVMVSNPAYTGATVSMAYPGIAASPQAPSQALFSTTWNFVAAKITSVNNNVAPPDTVFWHMAFWSDPLDASNHGFAIGFSRAATFNITPINTTTFDATFGKSGAAAGEVHLGTTTLWEDVGSAGNYQVTSQTYPGAFSTVTTGPYLGGQSRAGTQFGRVHNSSFTRISGAELPTTFNVDFDYRTAGLPSTEILCVFPTPCTTNVPAPPAQTGPAWLVGTPWAYGAR
jgi:hypothetical protein